MNQLLQKLTFILYFVGFIMSHLTSGQVADSVNRSRLNTIIIGGATTYTGAMIALNNAWYSQYDRQPFHFFNDLHEWKQMDKTGHVFSAYQISAMGTRALLWSGVNKTKSVLASTITSFAVMSSIELLDGFSSGYGASASDLVANTLGAGLYLGQHYLWNESRVYPKYSFHRTHFAKDRPDILGNGLAEEMLKDYNGLSIWLSVDMDKFMRFPKWLNLAVGYGAENMIFARDQQNIEAGLHPYRQLYLGLDFDLNSIKSKSKLINTLLFFANMVRLPAPAIEFSRGKSKGYLFYY